MDGVMNILSMGRKKVAKTEEKKVFGAALDKNSSEIPFILEACVVYLDSTGLDFEGIFRKSGSLMMMNDYKARFERGEPVDFSDLADPHIVAGLLKMYIREYPEPLLTFELYDCFLAAIAIPDVSLKVPKVRSVIEMLPPANLMVTRYLVSFLCRVSAKSHLNMMTPGNLAIVFAPNLLRPPYEGDKALGIMMEDTPFANELLQLFINHYEALFKDFEPKKSPPKLISATTEEEPNGATKIKQVNPNRKSAKPLPRVPNSSSEEYTPIPPPKSASTSSLPTLPEIPNSLDFESEYVFIDPEPRPSNEHPLPQPPQSQAPNPPPKPQSRVHPLPQPPNPHPLPTPPTTNHHPLPVPPTSSYHPLPVPPPK